MRLSASDRSFVTSRSEPLARALLLHADLERFAYQPVDYPGFPPNVLSQIREIRGPGAEGVPRASQVLQGGSGEDGLSGGPDRSVSWGQDLGRRSRPQRR